MKLVRIRLKGDVHGVGVQGAVTKVDPELAAVLFSQDRAEPYEPPAKKPTGATKEEPKAPPAEPPKPEPPIPVPLSDAELRLKLKEWDVKVPKGAKREELLKLYHENKPDEG